MCQLCLATKDLRKQLRRIMTCRHQLAALIAAGNLNDADLLDAKEEDRACERAERYIARTLWVIGHFPDDEDLSLLMLRVSEHQAVIDALLDA